MDLRLRQRTDELKRQWDQTRRLHPRIVYSATAAVLIVTLLAAGSGIWFLASLGRGGSPLLPAEPSVLSPFLPDFPGDMPIR